MSSLEEFVRRNRSLFPEDTRIYQQYTYFLLSEAQLREIGEPPDAEIYGVTIREKLVVPYGTDVTSLLGRYFKKSEVEVEYEGSRKRRGRQQIKTEEEVDYITMQDNIRKKVEEEWEIRRQAQAVGMSDFPVKTATKHRDLRDNYDHMHAYVTPNYIRSFYDGTGARYDDIYRRTRPGFEPAQVSDQEPKPRSSKPKKRLDTMPQFTTRLSSKRCMENQTIRFNCAVSGLPLPDITWFHGNKIINDDGRFRITV